MPNPLNDAHEKAFHWFAAGWLLAVAGSAVVAVVAGPYQWPLVVRIAVSLGVMPIVACFMAIRTNRWLRRYQERHYPES
jgi:hypothetical protein